ncbi:hypothetical protein QEH53_14555 [Pelagicoccus sp. SDUM812002]|nr:hypothetical protein [Pelagicoccus sp. SDUM812002]
MSAALAGWVQTDVHAAWNVAIGFLKESSGMMDIYLTRGATAEMAKQDPDTLLRLYAGDRANQKYATFGRFLIEAAFENGEQAQLLEKLRIIENSEDRNKWVSQIF